MSSNKVQLTFYGAAGTVTGSRYLISTEHTRVLVDCGLFQGVKPLRQKNWEPFPIPASEVDAVFLTHAHLDHSGYLPALVKQGFRGPIYCTRATFDLCKLLLIDAAKLAEEEAEYNNRHGTSKHHPALPLFTTDDAEQALKLFEPADNNVAEFSNIHVDYYGNGHILGSCFLDVTVEGRHILFSGDVGRPSDFIMKTPTAPVYADYLVVESTYGNRLHDKRDIKDNLADAVNETLRHGGTVLIPAFAVGRSQMVIYLLYQLQRKGLIPRVPIYLDSPMAISATELLLRHHQLHRLSAQECKAMEENVHFCRTVDQSIALNNLQSPAIIVSASGMATGGRVLHHLMRLITDSRNTIIFAGYQARGTRGARLVGGEERIRIFGQYFPVKAQIINYDFLSAHADRDELIHWLKNIPVAPKHSFVTHGEEDASQAFCQCLQDTFGWKASTPALGDSIEL